MMCKRCIDITCARTETSVGSLAEQHLVVSAPGLEGVAVGQGSGGLEGAAGQCLAGVAAGLQKEGQQRASDASPSRVPRQKHQQGQYPSSTLSCLLLALREWLLGSASKVWLLACRRRVNDG